MRLKIEFKYQCEVEIKEEEVKNLKDNLKYRDVKSYFSEEVNQVFLQDDGRNEWGEVVDFDYELTED